MSMMPERNMPMGATGATGSMGPVGATGSTPTPDPTAGMTPEQKAAYLLSLGGGGQSTTGLPATYTLPVRRWVDNTGTPQTYSGNMLLNLRTGATFPMYNLDQDPTAIIGTKLQQDGPTGLTRFLKSIQSLGFYGGAEVGNGFTSSDINAVSRFLLYSNSKGLEIGSALTTAQKDMGMVGTGISSPRVTSPTDLKAVFENVAMSTLGRGLKDSEINSMVAAYQSKERAASRGGVQAPNAQTYADEQLRARFKGEAQDFQAMNVAENMLNVIRSS